MSKTKHVFLVSLILLTLMASMSTAQTGASVAEGTPETAGEGTAGNTTAEGGNITEINLSATNTQTIHWQGFWGEVSGAIALRDAGGNTMYDWSAGTVSGNIYMANVSSGITWANAAVAAATACNDLTGTGDDSCENTFDDDTKTFTVAGSDVANVNIVQTYNNTGAGTWDEGILTDGSQTFYAATIYNEANTFKNGAADFQAIVPVNGATTMTYYFWLELGV